LQTRWSDGVSLATKSGVSCSKTTDMSQSALSGFGWMCPSNIVFRFVGVCPDMPVSELPVFAVVCTEGTNRDKLGEQTGS
jgi:hypothetical protein